MGKLPAAPTIPLTADARAAYVDLYNKIQSAIDSTMDLATVEALNPMLAQVHDVLTKDDLYKISANTAAFNALQQQINSTNTGLQALQGQIASIASHIATAGDILAAITKVLTLLP